MVEGSHNSSCFNAPEQTGLAVDPCQCLHNQAILGERPTCKRYSHT